DGAVHRGPVGRDLKSEARIILLPEPAPGRSRGAAICHDRRYASPFDLPTVERKRSSRRAMWADAFGRWCHAACPSGATLGEMNQEQLWETRPDPRQPGYRRRVE